MANQSVARKTAIGASWLIAFRLLTRVLGIVSTLVMARILVPADYGLVAIATTFAVTIDAFSQLGLQQALIRRTENDDRLHDTAFTLQVGRACLTGLIIAGAAPLASDWFSEPRLTAVLWVLAGLAVMQGLRNIGIVAFGREMQYQRQFLLMCVPRLVQVMVTIPLALTWRSYWALIAGIAVSRIADLLMTYLMHPYRPRLAIAGWRELASFSLWTWAASVASILWDRCDPFVIGPAVGTAQLAIYLLGLELATLPISEFVVPASDVLFSGFSMAQKEGSRPVALALPAATAVLLAIMPFMIAISCTAGYMVATLLGPGWAQAQPLVAIAVWLGLFSPYSYVCTTALMAAGHVRANFVANVLASVLKVVALSIVVMFTHDLVTIITIGALVIAGESGIYVGLLVHAGGARPQDCIGSLARILIAGAVTLGLMLATGLPWKPVDLPPWHALLTGGGLGCSAILTFVVAISVIWRLAGRPDGAETRIAGLLFQVAAPAWDKIAQLVRPTRA